MKKIAAYRRLFGATATTPLAALKATYRSAMKDWHPDRVLDADEATRAAAEEKSRAYATAYHFLLSIHPDTRVAGAAEYTQTMASTAVQEFFMDDEGVLHIHFADGTRYEYFGVPKAVFQKIVDAPSPPRAIRRHIGNAYVWRKVGEEEVNSKQ